MLAWSWVADYLYYRQVVSRMAPPGQAPASSLEDFMQFRRVVEFNREAEHLAEEKATMAEVRVKLGEPNHKYNYTEQNEVCWLYDGPFFRGHYARTLVFYFDLKTSRVNFLRRKVS